MSEVRRFIVIGAHPDDPDLVAGGTAILLARAGHAVKFVSATNGECGHQIQKGLELAARRYAETQKSAKLAGLVEYQVLGHPDAELEDNLANRAEILRIIRNFAPDVVITHRPCDYHADHRNTAKLVMDTSFLVQVPNYCPDTPPPPVNPVYAYCNDRFTDPRPLRPDAAVAIDAVFEEKLRLLDCHASQFYEWLPWCRGDKNFDASGYTWEQKREHLVHGWGQRSKDAANLARQTLTETYGEAGKNVVYAEAFEQSVYGRQLPIDEFRRLFQV